MNIHITDFEPPFKFYSLQKRYVKELKQFFESTYNVLLIEAGTGFGKTICNLYGAIKHNKHKIVYLSKTHIQNEQVINELHKINQKNNSFITGLQIASRKQLCHIERVAEAHHIAALDICNRNQKLQKRNDEFKRCISCVGENKVVKLPTILSLSSLDSFSKKNLGCAYLTARDLLNDFDVVTGNYNYYLNSDIRNAIGAEDTKPILVLDEGHNLEDVLTDQYSITLSHFTINNALKETKRVDIQLHNLVKFYATALEMLIDKHGDLSEVITFDGIQMEKIFKSFGFSKDREQKLRIRIKKVRDAISDFQKQETGFYPNHLAVDDLIGFLTVQSTKDFGYVIIKFQNGFRIRKECLNPALAFNEVQKIAEKIIICSGTLSPMSLWQEILDIKSTSSLSKFGSITDPRRVKVITFKSDKYNNKLSTKYSHRQANPNLFQHFRGSIEDIINITDNRISGGILVFVPSYSILNKLQLPPKLGEVFCFQEDQDSKKNNALVSKYKKYINSGNRALFAGVLGGKLSEGTDLPHELVRILIIIGIPYPPPKDPVIKLKRSYYDNYLRKGLGNEWYSSLAFRKIAQAIGRGWRSSTDYSIGIFLDERLTYPTSIEKLPLFIKNRNFIAQTWKEGMDAINKFALKLKDLDNEH